MTWILNIYKFMFASFVSSLHGMDIYYLQSRCTLFLTMHLVFVLVRVSSTLEPVIKERNNELIVFVFRSPIVF